MHSLKLLISLSMRPSNVPAVTSPELVYTMSSGLRMASLSGPDAVLSVVEKRLRTGLTAPVSTERVRVLDGAKNPFEGGEEDI